MIAIVLFVYAVFLITDLIPTFRTKKLKAILPCALFFVIGLVVQLLHVGKVSVPSPSPLIYEFYSSLFHLQ